MLIKRINESSKKNNIRLFSNISYDKLISLYKQCTAFVIPLRPNINDVARFPHKISEFCASGKPFISNNYGEVDVYFKDKCTNIVTVVQWVLTTIEYKWSIIKHHLYSI